MMLHPRWRHYWNGKACDWRNFRAIDPHSTSGRWSLTQSR